LFEVDEVAHKLTCKVEQGLEIQEVELRRQRFGPNALPAAELRSSFEIFSDQFKDHLCPHTRFTAQRGGAA
jgi:hypothetical protein